MQPTRGGCRQATTPCAFFCFGLLDSVTAVPIKNNARKKRAKKWRHIFTIPFTRGCWFGGCLWIVSADFGAVARTIYKSSITLTMCFACAVCYVRMDSLLLSPRFVLVVVCSLRLCMASRERSYAFLLILCGEACSSVQTVMRGIAIIFLR